MFELKHARAWPGLAWSDQARPRLANPCKAKAGLARPGLVWPGQDRPGLAKPSQVLAQDLPRLAKAEPKPRLLALFCSEHVFQKTKTNDHAHGEQTDVTRIYPRGLGRGSARD